MSYFGMHESNSRIEQFCRSITRDPRFSQLCDRLVSRARFYDVGDVVNILKFLTFLKMPTSSRVVAAYLQMLRGLVNDLNIGEISYLSFLMKKMDSTPIVMALRLALPIVFENKVCEESKLKQIKDVSPSSYKASQTPVFVSTNHLHDVATVKAVILKFGTLLK
jgi:hypothetical protein